MTNKEIIQQLKKQGVSPKFSEGMLADTVFGCAAMGRYFSVLFIRKGISPNGITMLMILSGIIGSILFAMPNAVCKWAGYIFWVLWYVFDNSDGQVARFTKRFSKYGTEMDYMAHLIDHPLMNLAIWITFIQYTDFNPLILSALFIACISCELVLRNITAFSHYHQKLDLQKAETPSSNIIKHLLAQFTLYPNMIVCFSWIIALDYSIKANFSIYLFLGWAAFFIITTLRTIIKRLMFFYRS